MRPQPMSLALSTVLLTVGCSGTGPSDSSTDTSDEPATAATYDKQFRDALSEVFDKVGVPHSGGDAITSPQFSIGSICTFLKPLEKDSPLQHPYFFLGTDVHASTIVSDHAGLDVVWDLYDAQAAAFTYSTWGGESGVSIGASKAAGLAFGVKNNVFDAWSGQFLTFSGEISLPFTNWLSAGVSYFQSPDGSLRGMSASGSIGLGFVSPVNVSASEGNWVPVVCKSGGDCDTEKLSYQWFGWPGYEIVHAKAANGGTYEYLQYTGGPVARATGMGADIWKKTGSARLAFSVIGLTIAIGVWHAAGKDIKEICG